MRKSAVSLLVSVFLGALILWSCSTPVGLTSWKNPENKGTISKIMVLGIFDKMDIIQPVETECANYFKGKNLPTIRALDVLNPFKQYSQPELARKLDSLGADGILIVTYKSKDVNVSVSPGYYGGYRGFWGTGGNVYVDKTYNLRGMLYTTQGESLLWSGDLSITNPGDATSAAQQIAQAMFNDWIAKQLLKNPPPPVK
jgi:hypothetical protein